MKYTEHCFKQGMFQEHETWIRNSVLLETIVGSYAYGCETKDSDYDVICIVMPKREHIFPSEYGYINGFDQFPNFKRKELKGDKGFNVNNKDIEIEWVSLVEFFYMAAIKGSPNLFESLFVHPTLITKGTDIGYRLRDNRHLFISMRTFHALKGYAFSQYHRIIRGIAVSEQRKKIIDEYGFDLKMASHTFRLISYLDQILKTGDLDLRRDRQEWKAIKLGEWGDLNKFKSEFDKRMIHIEDLSRKADLPDKPRIHELRNLLNGFIEEYYEKDNSLKTEYVTAKSVMDELQEIKKYLKIVQ